MSDLIMLVQGIGDLKGIFVYHGFDDIPILRFIDLFIIILKLAFLSDPDLAFDPIRCRRIFNGNRDR